VSIAPFTLKAMCETRWRASVNALFLPEAMRKPVERVAGALSSVRALFLPEAMLKAAERAAGSLSSVRALFLLNAMRKPAERVDRGAGVC
jgi:hypothetical protein